jgi:hypothetical protein
MKPMLGLAVITLLVFSSFLTFFILADDQPYFCTDTIICPSNCTSTTATCSISATVCESTTCEYEEGDASITCNVENASMVVIASTTSRCLGCNDELDPGDGFCDPIDPLWWLNCNPFPEL